MILDVIYGTIFNWISNHYRFKFLNLSKETIYTISEFD